MLQELFLNPSSFLVWVIALLVAITVHEFSHALAADRLGDPTPRLQGRLTLNPIAHLDPIGTLMLLIARFGWGKPVPIDPYNLQNPRRDSAIISLAGPGSNFILATLLSIILRLSLFGPFAFLAVSFLTPIIVLNVYLGLFNLLPIAPLDGFKIVLGFLPRDLALQWEELESYGLLFLLFLIFPFGGRPLISTILFPIINIIFSILLPGPTLI